MIITTQMLRRSIRKKAFKNYYRCYKILYVTNKICGMSKFAAAAAAAADCSFIHVGSTGKVWEQSISSLMYFTMSLHICITWECQLILKYNVQSSGIWRIPKVTKWTDTLIWGGKEKFKAARSFPFSRKVKKSLPFCTPACWVIHLPPHCWSVHNYSPGPCHHTPVVHSQIQELSVYPAKDRDFSEFLMVVLKKVDFLLCMGVQPINHVVVVYSALLFDCRLLGQCIWPVCFHFDSENLIILSITHVFELSALLSGSRMENELCLESIDVSPKVEQCWEEF